MSNVQELARITELVLMLEREREFMLRDPELLRELEFEKRCNALLDEFGCPVSLLLEVVMARPDVPEAIRKSFAKIGNFKLEPIHSVEKKTDKPAEVDSQRPASENASEWKGKFGHRSLRSWFHKDASEA